MRRSVLVMAIMGAIGLAAQTALAQGRIVEWARGDGSDVPPGNDYVAVSAGDGWGLALKGDGSLVAWGSNGDGQCDVPAGKDFVAISAGGYHGLALKKDGSIAGWGQNAYGEASAPAGNDYVALAAGGGFSLALKSDGSLTAWGWNYWGQCNVPSGNDFVSISASTSWGAALRGDGSIVAWGWSYVYHQTSAPPGNDFVAIACGGLHGLALKNDGSVLAWGGYGSASTTDVPQGNDVVAISAGWDRSTALKSDGSIVTWGVQGWDQIAPAGSNFYQIDAGDYHGVALVADPNPPTVQMNGDNPMIVQCHEQFTDPGATAADSQGNVLEVIKEGDVDTNTPGEYLVAYSATDGTGKSTTETRHVMVVDTIPPLILCPSDLVVSCDTRSTVAVEYSLPNAVDTCGQQVSTICEPSSGSNFNVGTTQIICTAIDAAQNASTCTFNVVRQPLAFTGFSSPIGGEVALGTGGSYNNPVRAFKLGSTVPVKFRLSCEGQSISTGVHTLQAIKYSTATDSDPAIDATPTDAATTGNQFRLGDAATGEWHFNLNTKNNGFIEGTWLLRATLSDGSVHEVWISIKK